MRFPNKETVERIRREYSAGARVELVRMEDVQSPPVGTKGTVLGVDDTGSRPPVEPVLDRSSIRSADIIKR